MITPAAAATALEGFRRRRHFGHRRCESGRDTKVNNLTLYMVVDQTSCAGVLRERPRKNDGASRHIESSGMCHNDHERGSTKEDKSLDSVLVGNLLSDSPHLL